jgi:hypothetical protein
LTPEHADDDTPGTSWNTDSFTTTGRPSQPEPPPRLLAASNCFRFLIPHSLLSLMVTMLRTASLTCTLYSAENSRTRIRKSTITVESTESKSMLFIS